ncbi:MAG: HD domain-containing protein [Bacilli bacterium]|nr:HD domain-containing protein [Bacilli bacterium]
MRYMNIDHLSEGMIVANDILSTNKNIPLVKNNSRLTNGIIENLKKCNIRGIYIIDDISKDINIVDNISPTLQSKSINALKNMKFEDIVESAKEIVEEYIYLDNISFDKLNVSNNMYEHSLNVCEFSVAVGKKMGYNREKLTSLAISALLHDIGKTCIDNNLLSKINISSVLAKKINIDANTENYHYYMHPAYGHNMLNNIDGMSSIIRISILQHHENENGTGFPLGLNSNEINEYAKIIHVCDEYDKVITKSTPSEALEYIMGGNGSLFNENVVKIFKDCIPIYPKGITVILSNGIRAVVLENHKENPLRPKLILESNGQVLDLIMPVWKNITIVDVDIMNNEKEKNSIKM